MRVLLTWSDRGVSGPRPAHHVERPGSDAGPVMRLVTETDVHYDRAIVLTTDKGQDPAATLVGELSACIGDVELCTVQVPDPTDYNRIFEVARDIARPLLGENVDVVLSAGTPQMQTIWVVMVKAGLLSARMLQVIPSAFVPIPHPQAVKEIFLDVEGFPEIFALKREVERLRAEVDVDASGLVGTSPRMRSLRKMIARVGASDVPVIVRGETGTGKELVAKATHQASRRREAPFIAENCGAFSEGVLHSELFGHEKGAFTGAHSQRRGLFEQAHGGTLFLDEVAELSPRVQATLLRVLQEGTLRRLGGETEIEVDVRVIAATHRDLRDMVDKNEFREDLYYRLRGAEVHVPSLRERATDIPELVQSFLSEMNEQPRVTGQAVQQLMRYPWPGNVRELRSEVVRWTVFGGKVIQMRDLAPEVREQASQKTQTPTTQAATGSLRETVRLAEDEAIELALETHRGNLSQTARALQIDRNTLKKKMARMGLR